MNVAQVFNIARREYIARVRNKAFIITTLLVPAFMAFYTVLPSLLTRADIDELRVVILDEETGQAAQIAEQLDEIQTVEIVVAEVRQATAASVEDERADLRDLILDGEIAGYILLRPDEQIGVRARYYARETGNIAIMASLERAIRSTVLENYLAGSGLDPQRVDALIRWDLDSVTVSEEGESQGGFERAWITSFIFTMILYITVLMGGQQMGMSIVEEKSSRLIELVLGAVTATEFMAGKIIGVLGAGLTQLAIWIGLALVATLYVLPMIAVGASAGGMDLADILNPTMLFYFPLFFLLGYLFYSVIFAAVASVCTSTEEFGQLAFPAMLPLMLAFFFTFYAIPNPSSLITRVVSLLPPFTPLVMLARINVLTPPFWEIWLGVLSLTLGAAVMVWGAAKIFRFALLMQGKRPTVGTVFRLMRAA